MRVLFAIKSLVVPGGGAERVLVDVANGLDSRGHSVGVVTFDPPEPTFYPLSESVERFCLDIGRPGHPVPRGRLVRALPAMRRAARGFCPDVSIAFMHSTYVPFGMALLGSGIPVVASEHAAPHHFRGRGVEAMAVRLTERLFVAKTVASQAVLAAFPPEMRARLSVLENPVDLGRFLRSADAASSGESRTVLVVGRLMEEKAHSDAIAAFARVADRFPDWCLRIVGDGELRPALERQVQSLGLQARVQMPGVSHDMVGEFERAALVFVPSRYESFGLAAAEAMASARPVLAAQDCVGVAALINPGVNGWLVPGGGDRVAAFAEALALLMGDADLRTRLGAGAPEAVSRFSVDSAVLAWERFLQQHQRSQP